MRRDADRRFDEDDFQIIFDAFNDSRNGYMFVTTPRGANPEKQTSGKHEGNTRAGLLNANVNPIYCPGRLVHVYEDLQQTGLAAGILVPTDRQLVVKMNYPSPARSAKFRSLTSPVRAASLHSSFGTKERSCKHADRGRGF